MMAAACCCRRTIDLDKVVDFSSFLGYKILTFPFLDRFMVGATVVVTTTCAGIVSLVEADVLVVVVVVVSPVSYLETVCSSVRPSKMNISTASRLCLSSKNDDDSNDSPRDDLFLLFPPPSSFWSVVLLSLLPVAVNSPRTIRDVVRGLAIVAGMLLLQRTTGRTTATTISPLCS